MSEIEGEPTPTYSADEGDILAQATPVPEDDDEEYPYGTQEDQEPGIDYDAPGMDEA